MRYLLQVPIGIYEVPFNTLLILTLGYEAFGVVDFHATIICVQLDLAICPSDDVGDRLGTIFVPATGCYVMQEFNSTAIRSLGPGDILTLCEDQRIVEIAESVIAEYAGSAPMVIVDPPKKKPHFASGLEIRLRFDLVPRV